MAKSVFEHHRELLQYLCNQARQTAPFCLELCTAEDQQVVDDLQTLASSPRASEDFMALGQATLCRIIGHYHDLTHSIHRDLLWYFGGDCLHFMPDEEIALYQRLDERCQALEAGNIAVNFADERANVFGLH